jgi:hypothetical protein
MAPSRDRIPMSDKPIDYAPVEAPRRRRSLTLMEKCTLAVLVWAAAAVFPWLAMWALGKIWEFMMSN